MTPEKEMVWSDGAAPFFRGVRTYSIIDNGNGTCTFKMYEKMGGIMFPMAASSIPSFDDSFNQIAEDLKAEAERIQQSKN